MSIVLSGSGNTPAIEGELPELIDVVVTDGRSSTATIRVLPEFDHMNGAINLFLVARVTQSGVNQWLYPDQSGSVQTWDQKESTLQPAYSISSVGASVRGLVYSGTLDAGQYEIYVGYAAAGSALIYSRTPFTFTVTQ